MDRSLLSKLFTCSFFIEILWEILRAGSNRFVSKEKENCALFSLKSIY